MAEAASRFASSADFERTPLLQARWSGGIILKTSMTELRRVRAYSPWYQVGKWIINDFHAEQPRRFHGPVVFVDLDISHPQHVEQRISGYFTEYGMPATRLCSTTEGVLKISYHVLFVKPRALVERDKELACVCVGHVQVRHRYLSSMVEAKA
jgi:hypothetical protein